MARRWRPARVMHCSSLPDIGRGYSATRLASWLTGSSRLSGHGRAYASLVGRAPCFRTDPTSPWINPPDVLFRYLIEPSLQALWSDVPMRQLTEGELRSGSRMEVRFSIGPLKAVVGLEFASVEPGRRLAFKSFSGPISWDGEYQLEAAGGTSTRVSQEGRLAFHGAWRLLEPIVGAEIGRAEVDGAGEAQGCDRASGSRPFEPAVPRQAGDPSQDDGSGPYAAPDSATWPWRARVPVAGIDGGSTGHSQP